MELEKIPCHAGATLEQALGEGEDYELLLAFPDNCWEGLSAAWRKRFPRIRLTKIGTVTSRRIREPELSGGWDHFAKA